MSANPPRPAASGGRTAVQRFSLARPILTCVILFVLAQFFRGIDSFLLRLDELLGEAILTKSLGFLLVVVWLWLTRRQLRHIGLHSSKIGTSLMIGAVTTVVAFVVGYSLEFLLAGLAGGEPALRLGAIDPKMGVTGGALFGLWLVAANFVNSFMEEGLFRGVMGRLGRLRFSFVGTLWFTAFMFGIWHLPWVVKYYLLGEIRTAGEIAMSTAFNSVPQLLIGLVYGYMYLKTGSLWAPWMAHTLSNSVGNLLHVVTIDGLDAGLPLRMGSYLIVMFLGLLWVRRVARKYDMPEAQPWS
jgi:membrane protease YdiL (CAAX protease family)